MPQPVTIEIPLPPAELWPGARHAEARKHRAAVNYRTRVCALVIQELRTSRPLWSTTRVATTVYWPDGRQVEPTALARCLEPAFEALGDAGLVAADHVQIRLAPDQETAAAPARPRVRLTVEWLGCEEAARLQKEPV